MDSHTAIMVEAMAIWLAIRFIRLVSAISMFYDHLFPGYRLTGSDFFQVIRDSELEIDQAAEDLVRTFQSALNRPGQGSLQCP